MMLNELNGEVVEGQRINTLVEPILNKVDDLFSHHLRSNPISGQQWQPIVRGQLPIDPLVVLQTLPDLVDGHLHPPLDPPLNFRDLNIQHYPVHRQHPILESDGGAELRTLLPRVDEGYVIDQLW